MRNSIAERQISMDMLDRLFNAELLAFQSDFEVRPVPIEQDLRAGAIAWIAAFAPEAISSKRREQLRKILIAMRERPDFNNFGWYRIPYLDVAEFLLFGGFSSLSTLIANINHHNRSLRNAFYAPFALVAPKLSLDDFDGELAKRIESSLEIALLGNDCLMCILCVLKDNQERKMELLKEWRKRIRLAPQDIETLDSLITDGYLTNSFLTDELFENLRYLFCRLLDPEIINSHHEQQPKLFNELSSDTLWKRMAKHPLLQPLVYLKKNTK